MNKYGSISVELLVKRVPKYFIYSQIKKKVPYTSMCIYKNKKMYPFCLGRKLLNLQKQILFNFRHLQMKILFYFIVEESFQQLYLQEGYNVLILVFLSDILVCQVARTIAPYKHSIPMFFQKRLRLKIKILIIEQKIFVQLKCSLLFVF